MSSLHKLKILQKIQESRETLILNELKKPDE